MALHHIGFTLRNTGGGFGFVNDSAHMPVGVSLAAGAVTHTTGNAIKVLLDQTYVQVVSVVVGPDEVMAKEGVSCGASVGLDNLVIKCFKDGVQLDPDTMTWANSNLWVIGLMSDA